jgi:hypothetical protein
MCIKIAAILLVDIKKNIIIGIGLISSITIACYKKSRSK